VHQLTDMLWAVQRTSVTEHYGSVVPRLIVCQGRNPF
jgi:hypothetical protein